MHTSNPLPAAAVGTFASHDDAEAAIRELNLAGFDITHLSVVGKGYHTDEHVTGFYNAGDRVRFWGTRGLFWGGLWGLFFGGVFIAVPVVGPVVVLGQLSMIVIAALESAVAVGGFSAVAAALFSIGIPNDSVLEYETAVAADGFLVIAHDTPARVALARKILTSAGALSVAVHSDLVRKSAPTLADAGV